MEKEINKSLIESKISMYKDGMIDFAIRLIQTKSISGHEKNVANLYIKEMNKLKYDEVFRDDIGNVIGIIYGDETGPTIMYNSHLDHVDEGELSNWEGYDPYGALIDVCEVDNQEKTQKEMSKCIHGRAASDVKGGAAVQIYSGAIIASLKKEGYTLKGTFMFTGVVLEETGENLGMRYLISKTLPAHSLDYDCIVSSEATSLKLYLGHRGRTEYLVTTYGQTSHGSAPWLGINAVYKALPYIEEMKDVLYPSLPSDHDLGQSSISLNIIECSPGALSIVPDKCMLSIDRRTIPGEKSEDVKQQFQNIIDKLSEKDSEFKATVEIKQGTETSYTGLKLTLPKDGLPWKIEKEHPFVKAAAEGLKAVGQEVKYDYWIFGTDMSVTAGIYNKPCIGYSPMQEQYAHTPYDKVRIDYMKTALEGNISIFFSCANTGKIIGTSI
ncbi:MAG: M20/M25/M40 family metallo-hydrolase [Clostridia bacterium]|jgi:putative selenium metabolism hydrolase|nr:M20/M25/M40 family metallo-hydrolase [Clostridia bacterium]MCI2000642.1 M20/M25/M40 family metallo-hydrolase [Clostridia bacterium]MCI2015285.1 M20/M25/M40 family metallo-hydrolase [Clostridia bacterium]